MLAGVGCFFVCCCLCPLLTSPIPCGASFSSSIIHSNALQEKEMRESRALTHSQMESLQSETLARLAAAQERVRRVEMQASMRLQDEEARRIALERERAIQRELSMVRVRERGLDSRLNGV